MAIHKLADGPITLTITDAVLVDSKFNNPQYQITGGDANGEETRIYVSQKAFEQQLGRLKLTPETAIGETLHFEQVKKDGTTYTNINKAKAGSPTVAGVQAERAQTAAAKPAPAPIARMTVAEATDLYGQCVDAAIAKFWAPLTEQGMTVSAEAIQSAAATIFIAVKGR